MWIFSNRSEGNHALHSGPLNLKPHSRAPTSTMNTCSPQCYSCCTHALARQVDEGLPGVHPQRSPNRLCLPQHTKLPQESPPPSALCWGFAGTQSCPKSLQHPPLLSSHASPQGSVKACWKTLLVKGLRASCSATMLRNHAPQPRRPARATHRRPRLTAALSSSSSQSMQAALAALSSSSS